MGSFASTCCVSDLPIEYGDEVRYFLLVENPYHHGKNEASMCCYVHDKWAPRTFPIRAKYNDYGSVEDVQEGPQRDIWFEAFQKDLLVRGVGENTCHDVPVRKDMELHQWLEALWEGRVRVHDRQRLDSLKEMRRMEEEFKKFRETGTFEEAVAEEEDKKMPEGIPTMRRIRNEIANAGLVNSDGNFHKGYMVSLMRRGYVRVQYDEFDNAKCRAALETLQKVLGPRYATMVTAGRAARNGSLELLVAPHPSEKDGAYLFAHMRPEEKPKQLAVAHAMVREDVWQELVKREFKSWSGVYRREDFLSDARKAWRGCKRFLQENSNLRHVDGICLTDEHVDLSPYLKDQIPFVTGLATHFKLMVLKEDLSEEEVEDFLQTVADFTLIGTHLMGVRRMWHPSFGVGPQFGEWGIHAWFNGIIQDLSQKKHQAYLDECARQDAEDAANEG